jgi:plastocyanin
MTRRRQMLLAVLAALVVAAPAWAVTPTLVGTVGPGYTISLKKGTRKVTTLRRGTYTIAVRDRSNFHNFRLRGPGVNRAITTIAFVGRKSLTVRLRPGRYTFLCDPHSLDMRGTFRVT